jgi:hypothetical protein
VWALVLSQNQHCAGLDKLWAQNEMQLGIVGGHRFDKGTWVAMLRAGQDLAMPNHKLTTGRGI